MAWLSLGSLYQDRGENEKALQAYRQAIVLDPDSKYAWFLLGELYKDLRQYNEMANSLENAVRLDSSMDGARIRTSVQQVKGQARERRKHKTQLFHSRIQIRLGKL